MTHLSNEPSDGQDCPDPARVLRQVKRIIGHPLFQSSPRQIRFLEFVVDRTLAGRVEQLKEYTLGVEVFARGESFNPQEDNIVRISAGRLRSRLAEYYQIADPSDDVLIDLPRGAYVPRFSAVYRSAGIQATPSSPRGSVGRIEEASRLQAAWKEASAGAGRMIAVAGDAGMGKTTLVEDFLAGLQSPTVVAHIGRGRCSERLAETDGFVPIFECLDRLLRGPFGPDAARTMETVAPTWYFNVSPSAEGPQSVAPKDARHASHERMRREFVAFFEELSKTRPVLLFFDDLHWADASTCDLIAYFGARIAACHVLVILTYRPASPPERPNPFLGLRVELERRGVCEHLALSFLSLSDISRYITQQFPANCFDAGLAELVLERTEGNPLFMTDMLRFLADRGSLTQRDGIWQLDQSRGSLRTLIPATIASMIGLKLNQLAPSERDLLLCAAVQGMQFDSAVLAEVLACDAIEVEERLQVLEIGSRLIAIGGEQEFANRTPSLRCRFVHVFYQNALYASLVPSRRMSLSLAVANCLERLRDHAARAISADLALLFEMGRDFAKASLYFVHAARHSARVFAYPEAAILCQRGLASLAVLPPSTERDGQELVLSLTLGMSLMATRGYAAPETEATHRRSRELCLKLNDPRRLLSVLWGLHTCEVISGNLVHAVEVAREMRSVADSLGDPMGIIESLHALGTTLAFMGRSVEAREALEAILASYPVDQHVFHGSLYVLDPCVTSLSMLARLLTLMGRLNESLALAGQSVDLANRLAHPPSLAYATFWVGWIRHTRGEDALSLPHLESAMGLCREHGLPQFLEWGRMVHGAALTRLKRVDEGIAEIRKSVARQEAMRSRLERSYCLTLLAEALTANGLHQEALTLCDTALDFAHATEGRCYQPDTHRVKGSILFALGDRERAFQEFAAAIATAQSSHSRLLELRAALSLFDAAGAPAASCLTQITTWFAAEVTCPPLAEARKVLEVPGTVWGSPQ